MNTLTFTLISFTLFVLYNESYALALWLRSFKGQVSRTFGRADWIYPVVREQQEWMRRSVVQSYSPQITNK